MQSRNVDAEAARSPFELRAGAPRDATLDGLRAIAVLAVVVGHGVLFRFAALGDAVDPQLKAAVADAAMTGVRIFFLVSGYVITRLLLNERRESGGISLIRFYTRRVTRIVPPFAIYLGMILVLSHVGYVYVPRSEIAAAGAFLCNTDIHPCSWFVGHSWSLAVEEQFYLLWPVLLTIVRPRWASPMLALVGAALLGIGVQRGGGAFNNENAFVFIVFGSFMASSAGLQRWMVSRVTAPAWLGAAVVFAVLPLFVPGTPAIVLQPFLLAILVFGAANVALLRAVLNSRPLQFLGGCSYSLYLWQELFLGFPRQYFGPPPPLWALPIIVWLSWFLVEKPGIALGRAWTRRVTG